MTTLCFVFHLNHTRIHLLTEPHHTDLPAQAAKHTHPHEASSPGHEHDHSDHHQPHSVADHELGALRKQQTVDGPLVSFLPASSFCIVQPDQSSCPALPEEIRLPGESPPDPFPARAPPLS